MKKILGSKTFWVCVFFAVVALVSRCVFDSSGIPMGVKISSSKPPHGCKNASYSFQFTAESGTTPYSWNVSWGTKPPGLNLDSSSGLLSGTPTQNGSYTFTVRVHDSSGGNYDQYREDVTISIKDFNITNSDQSATYCPGLPFEYQFNTCGGTGKLTWTTMNGSPPSGITLGSDGKLSGTTTATGTYAFTVIVSDGAGTTPAEQDFSLSSATSVLIGSSLTLPQGQTSKTYTPYQLEACGGTTPYKWTDVNTAIPLGLKLSASGLITGKPTQAGSTTFLVQVVDSASSPQSDSEYFTIKIVPGPLAIDTASPLSNASECVSYSTTLAGSGGTGSYTWTGSQLPSWLKVSSSGVLSGTPSTPTLTPVSFTITLSDGAHTVSKTFQLSVDEYPAATTALIIDTVRHVAGANGSISLTNTGNVKVDFRFQSGSGYALENVVGPATLHVIGLCKDASTTNFSAIQDINADGINDMAARFISSAVAGLLIQAGKAAGNTVSLRFTVAVKSGSTTVTLVQYVSVKVIA